MKVPSTWQISIIGTIILVAVLCDVLSRRLHKKEKKII